MSASCVITSTPDFEPPPQTPVTFLGNTAVPVQGEIIPFNPDAGMTFQANFRSEDTSDVEVELLLDYGFQRGFPAQNGAPVPYIDESLGLVVGSTRSNFNDTSRLAEATIFPGGGAFASGFAGRSCHRITLIAAHGFDRFTGCPCDLSDAAILTWDIEICPQGHCPMDPMPFDPADCSPKLMPSSVEASCPPSSCAQ